MKILIRNEDNVVLFAGDDLVLTDSGLTATDYVVPFCNLTDYTLTEVNALPACFSGGAFTYVDGFTAVDSVAQAAIVANALAVERAAKWEEVKALRTIKLNGGFEHGDHWYHSDTVSKTEFLGLKLKALETMIASGDMDANIQIDGTDTKVKTIDNGYMTVTGNKILAIVAAAEVQTKKNYTTAATHEYFLSISATPSTYDYSTGWPTVYSDV